MLTEEHLKSNTELQSDRSVLSNRIANLFALEKYRRIEMGIKTKVFMLLAALVLIITLVILMFLNRGDNNLFIYYEFSDIF